MESDIIRSIKYFFFDRTKVTVILFVIFSDLRSDNRTTYLEGIKSAFNFREEKKTSKQWRIAMAFQAWLVPARFSIGEAEKGDYF